MPIKEVKQNYSLAARIMTLVMYFCMVAIPLAFYLQTYDSCQIKITIFQLGGSLILACWVFCAIDERKLTKKRFFWDLAPLLYFLWGIVAYLHSPYKSNAPFDEVTRLIYYFGIFLTASDYFSQEKRMKTVATLLMVTMGIAVGYGFMQFFGFDPFAWSGAFSWRIFSTFGNPNFYGAFLVLTSPLLLSFFFKNRTVVAGRVLFGLLFVLDIVGLVTTGSKGSWLGIAAALFFFTILMTRFVVRSKRLKQYLLSFTMLVIVIAALGVYRYSQQRWDSIRFRLLTWQSTIEMIKLNPLLGNGLGTFRLIYPSYRHKEIFRIEGKHQTETQHPENEFLEIASDQGFIGFSLYLWLLYVVVRRGLKRIKEFLHNESAVPQKQNKPIYSGIPAPVYHLIGFIAGLLGLLAHNLFCVNLRFVSSGFFMWLFLGVINGKIQEEPAPLKREKLKSSRLPGIAVKFVILIITAFSLVVWIRFFLSDYHHNLGIGYSKQRMWDEAMVEYQTAIEYNPTFTMPRYFLGNVYNDRWQEGDADRALKQYDEVMRIAPNYVMVHYQRGLVFAKLKNYQEALVAFNRAIKLDPVYPHTYFRVGLIYTELRKFDQALENFQEAARLAPGVPDIYVNMGNIYLLERKFAPAEEQYRKALSIDEYHLNALRNLAVLLVNQHRKKEAVSVLEKLYRLNPHDQEVQQFLKSLSP